MGAVGQIGDFLAQTLLGLLLLVVVLRAILCAVRADYYNPISQAIVRLTNPLLTPVRTVLPIRGRLDWAALVMAVLIQALAILAALAAHGVPLLLSPRIFLWALIGVAGLITNIYFFALLAMIIVSWVASGSRHPAVLLIWQVTEPVMAPFRRLIPSLGGLDLSPILLFILINILQIFLRSMAVSTGLPPALVLGL